MQLKEFITAPKTDAIIPSGVFGKPSVCGALYFTPMYIYVITHPKFEGWLKIGKTSDLNNRLNSYQTHCPDRSFKLEYSLKTEFAYSVESYFNNFIKGNNFEWYYCSVDFAIKTINEIIQKKKIDPNYLNKTDFDENAQIVSKMYRKPAKYDYLIDGMIFNNHRTLAKYIGLKRRDIPYKMRNVGNEHGCVFNINGYEIIRQRHI